MRVSAVVFVLCLGTHHRVASLVANVRPKSKHNNNALSSTASKDELAEQKAKLFKLLGSQKDGLVDPVLADPVTKEPVRVTTLGTLLGGERGNREFLIRSPTNEYGGSSGTFLDLLEAKQEDANADRSNNLIDRIQRNIAPLIPPTLRSPLATAGILGGGNYVPMRDLFTSPSVSFAYERGWRQSFSQAGFPGADKEFEMARDFFAPAVTNTSVVVDMSCATGLFTRRFAGMDEYDRVLGCDYSEAMLNEARRRVLAEPSLLGLRKTRLDLVRLDVGQIPMRDGAVDALHAGAAMHCWPDLDAAVTEIYRVLKPNGGRYFATTFLSQYFGSLQQAEGGQTGPSRQAFQYFQSIDQMRRLLERGGFQHDKIRIELLGAACVVIRCEK